MHGHYSIQKTAWAKSVLITILSILVVILFRQYVVSALDITLPNTLQDFFTLSLSIFVEAFPFLVLGSLLASVVNVYVPPHTFERILPKPGFLRRGSLSLLGFLFPVCECGNVPLSRSLMTQGLKPSEAITFLLAAPVINPVTIWATWAAFGYDTTIVYARIIATLVIANCIGAMLAQRKNEQDFLTNEFALVCENIDTPSDKSPQTVRFAKFTETFIHEAFTMIKMLAFGVIIAGLVQTFVPRELLVNIGSNVLLSIIAMLLLAFIVSICANVDAFFALSFAGTFTAGSIVSFLVFGPMIDIKMLALLKTTFKTHLLVTISLLSLLMSAFAGLVVSYVF